ncbi:hypothetical protein BD309DRAFT_860932 [Dichomitus squalens]|uniref:T6SS Phospholipase effector Tle1-like catalytic domain-containing protein n=1 Tax=Dichomitus squalens TaxID=114155 RepID=A0A4Q9NY68_9APHY|nr:hypothetical protein BD309DRAFT_860932 [Dichomitus squalens]TBU63871.1 hypothetical protein BD310DRAFT_1018680 [Dichomitus squalens]
MTDYYPAADSLGPREFNTVEPGLATAYKRIIVCCDGTWDDALDATARWKYSNVTRIARAIKHIDDRHGSPIHQVVFYQSGIGTENLYDKVVDGVTGANLANKVEEAYGFIAQNYQPGDELFLFGFSRGAYTARMVAMFIGAIGVLNSTQMDHFADIFLAYQKRGKAEDPEDIQKLDAQLAPWTSDHGPGKRRAAIGPEGFSIKVIGVFDTVGSVGLPEELTLGNEKMKNIFGFPDHLLGTHVERAYHAMAINETRADFDVAKFEQTPEGRRKGQVLKQCWFTGCHSDIGGGYKEHDLMELTFNWIVANIEDALSLDFDYIASLPNPGKPWGTEPPHNPLVGIYSLAKSIQRKLPTQTDDITHEVIHSSVLEQKQVVPELRKVLDANPAIVATLLPWETKMKEYWAVKLHTRAPGVPDSETVVTAADADPAHQTHHASLLHKAGEAIKHIKHGDVHKEHVKDWLGKLVHESNIGPVVKEFL